MAVDNEADDESSLTMRSNLCRSRVRMAWRLFWNQIWTVLGVMPNCRPSSALNWVDGNTVRSNTRFNTWSCLALARLLFALTGGNDGDDGISEDTGSS